VIFLAEMLEVKSDCLESGCITKKKGNRARNKWNHWSWIESADLVVFECVKSALVKQ